MSEQLRPGFAEIVTGWMLIDDFDDLTDRIERSGEWARENGPLNEAEEATVRMMIQSQVARGIERGDFLPYFGLDDLDGEGLFDFEDEEDNEPEGEPGDVPKLGRCCGCGKEDATVRNIVMLHKRSPDPGVGCWGCFQCGLPMEGAVAVLCDECLERGANAIKEACLGIPGENRRIPVDLLTESFKHDPSKHPEEPSFTPPLSADV